MQIFETPECSDQNSLNSCHFWNKKSDAKFKEKVTSGFKYDIRSLVNLDPTTQSSENFTSMGFFCPKYIRFELKKYSGVISHDTEQ